MSDQGYVVAPKTPGVVAGRIFIYGLLVLAAVYFLLPFLVMVLTSLKSMEDIRAGTLISLPRRITLEPWREAWGLLSVMVRDVG